MNTNITDTEFKYVSELASENSAIVINDSKRYLVESRLGPLARKCGCRTLGEFIQTLRAQPQFGDLHAEAIDALTTNETYFFRDFHPFSSVKDSLLPDLIKRKASTRSISIWSAACSTGQEPYSLAMTIRESFPELADWNVSILATDISPTVLEKAKAGRYNQIEVNRGLPANLLLKYFRKEGDQWCIDERLKKSIEFKEMNLIKPWPIFAPFDLILMRNVLIYFDVSVKRSILNKLGDCIRPHGHLFLGTSESVLNLDQNWDSVTLGKAVAYKRRAPGTLPTPGLN